MTKYRKQGFKSAGNAARYSKVTSAQNLRWARLKRPHDHDYFCSDLGPDLSHVEREEEVESADTKECKDWRLGRRIVELDVLAKGLSACGKCGLPLNLDHTKEIQTYGLGSLLKVQCFNTNCMYINHIPTGKRHDRIWDVNTKLATGLVHSGIAVRQLNSLLAELNIPTVHYKTINARLKETGKMVEKIAMDSTDEALQNEIKAVEQTNGKFVDAVDADWKKRGSGRSYNSLSGHCSMVGTQTGQIIHYAVPSKDCRVCSTAASRNEPPKPHDCYQNWEGSAKAMEADMVTQMVKDVGEKGFKVEAIVGDEDSTTIGRLRANVNEKIEKISDKNHIRKLLGNSLYALKKQHPMLTVKVIKYLQRCFDYIIAQGKENPSQISSDLNALSKHPFGDHSSCSSRWCRFIGNPNCLYRSFPHGKPLANQCLQSSLEKVFSTYAGHSNKLSSLGSTQGNESFNHMVAAKAPKNIHFSSSGNLSYRVAACVAQKNSGHKYLVSVNRSLGLSPGFYTNRLAKLRDSQRIKQRAVANSHKFKRKRLAKKSMKYQRNASLEVREGTSYQSGCTIMGHLSTDIQSIPAPVIQPEYTHVEKEQLRECHLAFFDVETTGLGRDSHIIQLSVCVDSNEEIFNCYIKPGKKISPAASIVTGIQFENRKMYHNNREVEYSRIQPALEKLFVFLAKFEKVVLVGHNCKSFDIPVLLSALENNNMLESFMSTGVIGVIDTLPLFKVSS